MMNTYMPQYPLRWKVDKSDWHFHRRMFERYGIVLENGDYQNIIEQIKTGKAILMRKSANVGLKESHDLYAVKFRDTVVIVVIDGNKLITAYPQDGFRKLYHTKTRQRKGGIYLGGKKITMRADPSWKLRRNKY